MNIVTERDTHVVPQPYKGEVTEEVKKRREKAQEEADKIRNRLYKKYNLGKKINK